MKDMARLLEKWQLNVGDVREQMYRAPTPRERPRRHGPGPGPERRGAAGTDDRRPVEELQDAGALHRAPGGGTGCGGQVLPGERGLDNLVSHSFEIRQFTFLVVRLTTDKPIPLARRPTEGNAS